MRSTLLRLAESYDFAFTDILIEQLYKAKVEPFFRLGVTIENYRNVRRYTTYPPADPAKWARICEHIIRHYNEGWADGFHYGIKYWEIWNEPDDCLDPNVSSMWCGTKEEYYELYEITAKHLKSCFGDSIKVGGYAATGVYCPERDPDLTGLKEPAKDNQDHRIDFIHGFFKHISSTNTPIDYFSWHSYKDVKQTVNHARYYEKIMEKYGYGGIESILNEWNMCWAIPGVDFNEKEHPAFVPNTLAMMLAMQREPVTMLHFYDARMGASFLGSLFNCETKKPTNIYFTFHMFNSLYKLGTEAVCSTDDADVYALAATNGKRSSVVIANTKNTPVEIDLDILGADGMEHELLQLDSIYRYSPTGKDLSSGKLVLPALACAEIRYF